MRVRGNWISLFAWRSFSSANSGVEKSIARVSSGLSINSAADDAAGLGISQRIKTQFRGLAQANRNALDGISLVNTAEGALNEIHSLLQRGRELSVQAANGTLDNKEKASIQYEIDQILAEIDRISGMTTFNNRRLLSSAGCGRRICRDQRVAHRLAGTGGKAGADPLRDCRRPDHDHD